MSGVCNQGDSPIAKKDYVAVDAVFAAQRSFFCSGKTRPLAARVAALQALERGIAAREDELLAALDADLGKPGVEAWLAEVRFLRDDLELTLRKLGLWARPRRARQPFFVWPARSWVRPEPLGVTLVVAPWNYPLQLALSPAIAAIAAGNTVVIKPSEHAPATAARLAELVAEACDPGHATVVEGDAVVGQALLDQPFDLFFFTGGEEVGGKVAKAAARHRAPSVLELGGKSPAIVDSTANLDVAVERIALGKFFNAGQTCMAPDFVAVEERVKPEFVRRLRGFLESVYPDPPDLARMIHRGQYDRVLGLAGPEAVRIGTDDPGALKLAPRFVETDWSHPAMAGEIFGPLLPVVGFGDRAELVGRLASMPAPLALYVFSSDRSACDEWIDGVRSGSVCINDVMKQAINLHLPFGGVGASGYGRYRGEFGFRAFSHLRAFTRRYAVPDPFRLAPPYGDLLAKLRRWM